MAHKIHVLLVEHEGRDHDKTKNMLHYFSYEVTPVKFASTAVSILSKGKGHFDVVMANMNSPDSYAFQLLQDAVRMGLIVILMADDDDAVTTLRAIEQGAFLCIKKPITMQIVRYLWQHVLREKVGGVNKREQFGQITKCNTFEIEYGEEDLIEGSSNENDNAEQTQKSKKKANAGTLEHDNVIFRRKVWTEWTQELHDKFMDAVRRLGEGRCYPKEILELMDVPGLTRMQVASHLQKCRNANWVPPSERRSKQENPEMTNAITRKNKLHRAKTMRFGSMPQLDRNQLKIQQQLHKNYQELTIAPPNGTNVLGDLRDGISDKGYYLHLVLNNDNATFNKGNLGQIFDMNEEAFIYGAQSVTPSPNTSSNQRYISEDGYEFPIMDSMVQDFSTLQQELGLDFNGNLQSLVLDQGYYDQMPATNMYWGHEEGTKSLNNEENKGQMGEESWA